MSLTKDALQLIIADAIAAQGKLLPTDRSAMLVPEGFKVQSLEHLQDNRNRFRGALTTSSIKDFSTYTLAQLGATDAFVDADKMACTAFYNLGDYEAPGHADHTATLTLTRSPAYVALLEIAGSKISQKDLAEWLEDWAPNVKVTSSAGKDMDLSAAIASVRNVTIKAAAERNHSEHNFGAAQSSMDSIEAANQDALPAVLHFSFSPYEGLSIRVFNLRVSLHTGGDKPVFSLRWVQEGLQREEIAQEFKDVLAKEVGAAATLTIGTFNPGN